MVPNYMDTKYNPHGTVRFRTNGTSNVLFIVSIVLNSKHRLMTSSLMTSEDDREESSET